MGVKEIVEGLGGKYFGPNRTSMVCCPAHDDKKPSLAIKHSENSNGFVVQCHAGCDHRDVFAELEKRGLFAGKKANGFDMHPRQNTTYDLAKKIWADATAIENTKTQKYLSSRKITPNNFGSVRHSPALYHRETQSEHPAMVCAIKVWPSEEVVGIQRIFLQEDGLGKADVSEPKLSLGKMAEGAVQLGQPVDTLFIAEGVETAMSVQQITGAPTWAALSASGIEKVKIPETVTCVVIAADNDASGTGQAAANRAAKRWADMGKEVRVAVPNGLGRDWNDMVKNEEELEARKIIDEAPMPVEPVREPKLTKMNIGELMVMDVADREMVLNPIIPTQGLVMAYAPRGIGKTFFGLSCALAVACGASTLHYNAPKARKVLYIDGEMPLKLMQERVKALFLGLDEGAMESEDYFELMSHDGQKDRISPDIGTARGRELIEENLDDCEFLVLDNLSTLTGGVEENNSDAWHPINLWLLSLRRRKISVLMIHHAGKGGAQRGTSRREDVLDTVINLKKPNDYTPEDGARFEVHLEKARGLYGSETTPFEARLMPKTVGEDEEATFWAMQDLKDVRLEKVKACLELGMSVREIAEDLGVGKTTAHKLVKRAKEEMAWEGVETAQWKGTSKDQEKINKEKAERRKK